MYNSINKSRFISNPKSIKFNRNSSILSKFVISGRFSGFLIILCSIIQLLDIIDCPTFVNDHDGISIIYHNAHIFTDEKL